ncbi:UNVERIFIED_CONTAM: hypothetical protein H355_009105 [Colinus virginianus]|nr:hypothetical protein H355_009105 [Colinus virginianus]
MSGARALCRRALSGSAALCASRNLLRKMLRKKKKKFWYDSPTLGYKMVDGPTKLATVKTADRTKTGKEDTIRCRVLNSLIHKAVTEMMSSCEINKEIYDLKLEICKASRKASAFLGLL